MAKRLTRKGIKQDGNSKSWVAFRILLGIILVAAIGRWQQGQSTTDFLQLLSSSENQGNSSATNDKPLLWLTTCETDKEDPIWMQSAKHFQEASAKARKPVEVRIVNICHGQRWTDHIKFRRMKHFLKMEHFKNNKNSQQQQRKTYVVFSDFEAILNTWAVPDASIVIERFHKMLIKPTQSVVISAGPNCGFGIGAVHYCSKHDLEILYPDAPKRTNCPVYINAGQYMGLAETVLEMMEVLLSYGNPQDEGEQKKFQPYMIEKSDQARMTAWYAQNRHKAVVDAKGSLFRRLMFGDVNKDVTTSFKPKIASPTTCGTDGITSCGYFEKPYGGIVSKKTLEVIMTPVPTCETEAKPWFIHGNAWTRDTMMELMDRRAELMEEVAWQHRSPKR